MYRSRGFWPASAVVPRQFDRDRCSLALSAADVDYADRHTFSKHWRREYGAIPQTAPILFGASELGVMLSFEVSNMNRTALQDDARVWLAPATVDGKVGLRPCFANYRTVDDDVRALVDIAVELGGG